MKLYTLLDQDTLAQHILAGLVRAQDHPTLPLRILNYTERCAYDGAWDDVTRQCRGLIYDTATFEVVARPFPKFFNYGQPGAADLDLDAPAWVTEKMDGSLGILYPVIEDGGVYAVATRGSFTSEQALHATEVWRERYAGGPWFPTPGYSYLFEIIYPGNRIVCDYGDTDDLVLLAALSTETGGVRLPEGWPGPSAEQHPYRTLREALEAEPRPNAEGFVVTMFIPDGREERVKIKQDDYVALHRILTGTNARNVWEVAAVTACVGYVTDPKQWGSFLRIDPARADEVLALGDDWLAGVPDEFYGWIEETTATAEETVYRLLDEAQSIVEQAKAETDRRTRYELVVASGHPATQELMRLAEGRDEHARLVMRCWLAARPEPTSPFSRSEAVA